MRISSVGHLVFAGLFIGLGIQGLLTGHFTAVWAPVPPHIPARQGLAYLCALVSVASGLGLLFPRTAALAARLLFGSLLLWCAAFRLIDVIRAPVQLLPWYSLAETMVMVAGAWVLYAKFAADRDRKHPALATGDRAMRIAQVLYGLCMIPFGIGHFVFLARTESMVPGWLPAPKVWAILTGIAFVAAGASMVVGVLARLAATLSVWQIGLFNVLVWIPLMAGGAGAKDPSLWTEYAGSIAIMAGGWVVADSYRSRRAAGERSQEMARRPDRL